MSNTKKKKKINDSVKPKKTKIKTLIIFSVIYAIIMACIIISAVIRSPIDSSVSNFVFDDFEVFSDVQEQTMNENCKTVQKKYGINVYISTCERIDRMPDSHYYYNFDNRYYAGQDGSQFIAKHRLSYHDNFVVIIINCMGESIKSDFHFDVYTYGNADKKISDGEINKLIWSSSGDKIVSNSITTVLEGIVEMTTDVGKAYSGILSYRWNIILLVTLTIGAVIAIIVVVVIKNSYSKERGVSNYSFTANTNLNLKVSDDNFIRKTVTYTRISSSSRGGGMGGGSSSSGGGGGAGHRGGR